MRMDANTNILPFNKLAIWLIAFSLVMRRRILTRVSTPANYVTRGQSILRPISAISCAELEPTFSRN